MARCLVCAQECLPMFFKASLLLPELEPTCARLLPQGPEGAMGSHCVFGPRAS